MCEVRQVSCEGDSFWIKDLFHDHQVFFHCLRHRRHSNKSCCWRYWHLNYCYFHQRQSVVKRRKCSHARFLLWFGHLTVDFKRHDDHRRRKESGCSVINRRTPFITTLLRATTHAGIWSHLSQTILRLKGRHELLSSWRLHLMHFTSTVSR